MSQLPPGFVLDQQPARQDPVIAVDPFRQNEEARKAEDQEIQRRADARAAEAAARAAENAGVPSGYRKTGDGKLEPIPGGPADPNKGGASETLDPKTVSGQRNIAAGILKNTGVNLETGVDPVAELIRNSTSGKLQAFAADAYGAVTGDATSGMEAIGKLKPLLADMTLQMTGGSLGNQISDGDRKFIMERMGNIADPNVPADQRLASWEEVKRRLAMMSGVSAPTTSDDDGPGLEVTVTDDSPRGGNPPPGGGGGPGLWEGIGQGVGSMVEAVGDTAGIVVNPINTVLGRAAGYDNYTSDFGTTLREALQLPDNQSATGDAIIKGATAGLGMAGLARGGANLATGAFQNALARFAATPGRDMVAGGAAGLGGQVGQDVGGAPGQVAGTLLGGMAGYGGANALMRAAGPRAPTPLAEAATRQGVDLLPADAGGPIAKAVTTGTKASPLSVAPVVKASQRQQGQMADATRRAAGSQGQVVDTDIAGQGVRSAAERFTRQTSERGSRLYTRANDAAKGVRIKPVQTMAKLDEYIARVKNDPSAPESAVTELERFRDNIANGVNVAGLRDARTRLSQGVYDGQLRSNQDKGMWKDILGNLSSDIENGLTSVGKRDAAAMFKRADAFWRDRVEHIDEVLQPILGKDKGGEQIVTALESMAKGQSGGNARLSRLLSNMTPKEAGQVRATIINRLGKANPGAQDAEGTAYSAATFLTNWNKMTPQAKASLFSDKGLRSDLNDLALLAENMKASQSMANFSNTGVAIGSNVAAATALTMAHPVMTVIAAGAQYLTGRLMASPGFARMLAKTANLPPEVAQKTLTQRLATIAANDNAVAADAKALSDFLATGAGKSPGTVAAAEDENNARREPPQ